MAITQEQKGELMVKIQAPMSGVWEGTASAVSSINSTGPFDILPDHANMITLVEGAPITVISEAGEKTFTFTRAVLSVHDNTVSIYADIGNEPSEGTREAE